MSKLTGRAYRVVDVKAHLKNTPTQEGTLADRPLPFGGNEFCIKGFSLLFSFTVDTFMPTNPAI
jgi:hypothetical protein